jgi:hypothetical protein
VLGEPVELAYSLPHEIVTLNAARAVEATQEHEKDEASPWPAAPGR